MSDKEILEIVKEVVNELIGIQDLIEALANMGLEDSQALTTIANLVDDSFTKLILVETELK